MEVERVRLLLDGYFILCRLNIPRVRIIHSSSLTGLKWKGTRMYMGAGGGGPHIWPYPTNTLGSE